MSDSVSGFNKCHRCSLLEVALQVTSVYDKQQFYRTEGGFAREDFVLGYFNIFTGLHLQYNVCS